MPTLDELRKLLSMGVGKTSAPDIREGKADWGDDSAEADHLGQVDPDAMARSRVRAKRMLPPRYTTSEDGDDAILHFGKFKTRTLSDIWEEEPSYIAWLIKEFRELPDDVSQEFVEICKALVRRMSSVKAGKEAAERRLARAKPLMSGPILGKKLDTIIVDDVMPESKSYPVEADMTKLEKWLATKAKKKEPHER